VDRGDEKLGKHYSDPKTFFEATYLTKDLRRLLSDTMSALGGKNVDRVLQLRTPFGGGKTHSLVAMLHLAGAGKKTAGVKDLQKIVDREMSGSQSSRAPTSHRSPRKEKEDLPFTRSGERWRFDSAGRRLRGR